MAIVKRHYYPWLRNLCFKSPWASVRKLFSSVCSLQLSWKGSENPCPRWGFPWFSPCVFGLWDRKALTNWTAFDNDIILGYALFSLGDGLHTRAGDHMLVTMSPVLKLFSVNQVGTTAQVDLFIDSNTDQSNIWILAFHIFSGILMLSCAFSGKPAWSRPPNTSQPFGSYPSLDTCDVFN